MINFEEFKRVELKVARIITAEKVPNSENLLKLQIDLGGEMRQIISGIAKFYQPENLIGKDIIVVANLEPKEFMGVESQGMLLAAGGETLALLTPDKEVKPGSPIS